jgi:hypothetical protein
MKLLDILNEDWSQEYKDSIDCDNPKGFSQKAHCQGKEKKESVNEGVLQDRERKLKGLPNGVKVSGGGYGPFTKIGSNTFKSQNGKLLNSEGLIKLIGTFKDFKIHETIKEESLSDLEKKLKSHDWWYAYSDDNRKYKSGETNWFEITKMIKGMKGNKEAEKLWNKYSPKDFNYSFKELSETQLDEGIFKIGVKHIIPLIPTGYAPNDPKYKMDLRVLRNMLNNFYKERGYEKVILPTF